MKKILFLINSKASIKVIVFFILQKIKNIFIKEKIKRFKKRHQFFLSKKKISDDYFSMNSFNFYYYLRKKREDFKYLEIGSYEGNSAIFVAENFKKSQICCVDHWFGHEKYYDHQDFSKIEKNFDFNVKDYRNIVKVKKKSDNFFLENKKNNFDVIYIDGDHTAKQVYKDCINAWNCLKVNGILILDDYIWKFFDKIEDNPCYAINLFLKKINRQFKILQVSKSQIFLMKKI